ncbi:MAG: hypothetical protein NZP74_08670 [Anaerolineales bacterium]|nr:hypothetical protein [Anaerolineales bacterium]MDW8277601.1 hypothetical protein [Anaerolineales bacterium]
MPTRKSSAFRSLHWLPFLAAGLTGLYFLLITGYALMQGVQLTQESRQREVQAWADLKPLQRENLSSLEIIRQKGLLSRGTCLAFSPSGHLLASGSDAADVTVFDSLTGARLRRYASTGGYVLDTAFSPDETVLATAEWNGTIRLWGMAETGLIGVLNGHSAEVNALAFHPNGNWLASGGGDSALLLWNWREQQVLRAEKMNAVVGAVAFSPDGRLLAAGDMTGALWLWSEIETQNEPRCRWQHPGGVSDIRFSADSRTVYAAGGASISRWNAEDCSLIGLFSTPESQPLLKMALSPDERLLAGCGGRWREPHLWIWTLPEGNAVLAGAFPSRVEVVRDLLFDPTGRALLTVSHDGQIRWWGVR